MLTDLKKSLLILVSAITISSTTFSQNPQPNTKRGFKNFIIGDDKSKYEGKIECDKINDQGNVFCQYLTREGIDEIFLSDYKFNYVQLGFDKENKLVSISLVRHYDKDSYSKGTKELPGIINELSKIYGSFSRKYEDQKTSTIGTSWVGKEFLVDCTNMPLGSDLGSETQIFIRKI